MTDLTVSLYRMSNVDLSRNFTLLSTDNFEFAFEQVTLTCFLKSRVEESHIPRCLCSQTLVTKVLLKIIGRELNKLFFW